MVSQGVLGSSSVVDGSMCCAIILVVLLLHTFTVPSCHTLNTRVPCTCQASFIGTSPTVKAITGMQLSSNKKYLAVVEQTYEDEQQQVQS